ncbi:MULTISPECIES: methyltransferase domain-containing protein [unclassified Bradyrhizobium]|uniref:class I SAM-dependent methyltransferase n=1 Tax=unclassified Bradyrhizobium TaxID=2631580 RepID=UPI001FFB5EBE|nr:MULTISPECIES: methyltransferase domain-containing protein [unclassified Bradyrhizobium]MCK1631818.1 methyltransferase domain-containing protein [Bradyrhizobium sp. 162]MCK1676452.1 methyltransferase domain-containing protein [Bradyrhizobium sp. 150]
MNEHVVMDVARRGNSAHPRVLVAIASYGSSNDRYLEQIIKEYRSMPFAVDVVMLSNIDKSTAFETECLVGLPTSDPWSLPFAHKKLFAERRDQYDLFIYSEDDILISERNVRAWLNVTPLLPDNEIAGFIRVEIGDDGKRSYPDVHAYFHWDTSSVRRRGDHVLAHFTNEHAACFVLTREQLRNALNSGRFDVLPYDGKYDLPCTAATDPYTQCGLKKLIPVSHLEEFTVHHMSNKYVGKVGTTAEEFDRQVEALLQIAQRACPPQSLLASETKLPRGVYSKDYYEPLVQQVVQLIPVTSRSVLSIGCGSGATETWLVQKGISVTAIPLDPAICRGAAENGVDIIEGDFRVARACLDGRRFDCILMLNVLHLVPKPVDVLSAFGDLLTRDAPIIIQSPNMAGLPTIWRQLRDCRIQVPRTFQAACAHFSYSGSVEKWCRKAGLSTVRTVGVPHRRAAVFYDIAPAIAKLALSSDLICIARRGQ